MESLPLSWSVRACNQGGEDGAGLLRGAGPDAHAQVCDLFHEDAQVGISNLFARVGV